ncbi:Apoptosis inhibitor 5-B [Grifola frondosa]|uniref:Apoptosis inhibitor 5-B n=1 Tax=Grifola frondosa TaxID=5627 RepID=A0A1C7M3R7_GRIFR|nr:Apoptosis inhibitor 5-B [Grifola frondosa]
MSLAEQEKEIKEQLRRAERTPNRTSASRRETLKRLIDLAHSPHPSLKIIAANNLKFFIKDFPDLEDDAINAVYDLCEDQVSQVRIMGYAAIVDVSKEQQKWVKRNADVLVQLLQSDEPEEVVVVKKSLTTHLDMDPAVTLGVLCDQIVPPDEPMDEEEQAIRDRLRSLVFAYVTGEAKRAIVERHTSVPGSPAEEVLVSGLFKAITKLPPTDIDIIVKDILVSLPTFKPNSSRGRALLDVVLGQARSSLKIDLPAGSEHSSLDRTRYYLELASFIAVARRLAHPSHLLRFYYTSLTPKLLLVRLTEDAQMFVISRVAETFAACEELNATAQGATSTDDALLRKQFPDVCTILLQFFSATKSADIRPWNACRTLLQACVRRKQEANWTVPSHLAATLRNIEKLAIAAGPQEQGEEKAQATGRVAGTEDVQSLIRSLLEPVKPRPPIPPAPSTPTTDVTKGMSSSGNAGKNDRRIMNVNKRKLDDRPLSLPPRPQTVVTGGASTPIAPRADRQRPPRMRERAATASTSNGHQPSAEDQPRAPKRAKKGGGGPADESKPVPSLLSRLQGPPSPASGSRSTRLSTERDSGPIRHRTESSSVLPTKRTLTESPDPDRDPVGGYSIRGAARAAHRASPSGEHQLKASSLLDRMQGGDDGDANGRNKRRKRTTRP